MDYEDPDRPRGILSSDDREFLLGEKEYKHRQSRVNTKSRIRERVKHSLLDFALIYDNLEDGDIRQIFDFESEEERRSLDKGLTDALSLIYFGAHGFHPSFRGMLKRGVSEAESRFAKPGVREVDVTFEVEPKQRLFTDDDVTHMVERVKRRGIRDLSDEEQMRFLSLLRRSEEFDPEMALRSWEDTKESWRENNRQGVEATQKKKRELQRVNQERLDEIEETDSDME